MSKIMKKSVVVIVLGAISLSLLASCKQNTKVLVQSSSNPSEDTIKPEEMVLENNRFTLRATWFKDTREVAQKSGDEEAMAIISFLEDNSTLSEPALQGIRFLESANEAFWFSLVPIITGDHSAGPMWEKYYSPMGSGGVANFQPDGRALIIKSHIKVSPLWHGIILLHEGKHAREFITRKYDWKDAQTFCIEERNTHDFQNRVTGKLGGEKYHMLVNSLAEDIEAKLKEKGYSPGQALLHRSAHFSELEEIFTPALSRLERDYRESSVWIHANFVLLEKMFGAEAPEKKALFLKTIYSETGVLPH